MQEMLACIHIFDRARREFAKIMGAQVQYLLKVHDRLNVATLVNFGVWVRVRVRVRVIHCSS